ncbi:hypothetical protein [Streptomyces ehimensis]|uniref:Uncharacterized protein n=1 Tax=Streptomyces ehimensis TaxID=68195 RepID=A0ABV9BVV9_9ACTN
MTDTEEIKKEQAAIDKRLIEVEKSIAKSAAKDKKDELPFGALWSNKDWKLTLTEYIEIIAIAKATSLIKIGLPAVLDLGKIVESLIEKKYKRNKWGWIFGKKPDDPLPPQIERIDALESRMSRADELRPSVIRFNTQYPASRSERINSDIQSLKGKVRHLEENRRQLRNSANATPPPRRSNVDGIGSLSQAADQINRLEERITHLARALG